MTIDETEAVIDVGRLLVSPANAVYDYLKDYAERAKSLRFSWAPNEELEYGLLHRNDRLIDLGLAQYCGTREVWAQLYDRGRKAPQNEQERRYLLSLRVACLANEVQSRLLARFPSSNLDETQLKQAISEGTDEELAALLTNPRIESDLLVQLFERKGFFAGVDERQHMHFVIFASRNPRLVTDASDEHGPDMDFRDLQRAIVELLRGAPVTMPWLRALRSLLDRCIIGDSEQPGRSIVDVIERWSKLTVRASREDREHTYSDEYFRDESICMMAALYGTYYESVNGEFKQLVIGDLNSPGVALRCAAYATVKLTPDQMQAAIDRDGNLFLLAVLRNVDVLRDKKARAIIEREVGGWVGRLYRERCQVIHRRYPWFDPSPVTQEMQEQLRETTDEEVRGSGKELIQIEALLQQVNALARSHRSIRTWLTVGCILVGILIWLR